MKTIQAKDIEDDWILDIVREANEGRMPSRTSMPDHPRWCLTYDIEERLPSVPPKVLLAKCRSLIRRGKMHGCPCGCRGDFYLEGYGW